MRKLKENIIDCLNSEPGIASITLFGSQAKNTARKDSDVDTGAKI